MMVGDETKDQPNAPAGHWIDNGKLVGRRICFAVAPGEGGLRLDLFLTGRGTGLSRSQVQRAVAEGRVRVNGSPVRPEGEGGG